MEKASHEYCIVANKSTSTSNPLTITFHRDSGKSMDEPLCKKSRITSQPSQPAEKIATIPGNVEKAVFIEPFCKENVNCINFINTDVYGQQKIKIVKNNTFEENDKIIMSLNLSVNVVNKDDVQFISSHCPVHSAVTRQSLCLFHQIFDTVIGQGLGNQT
ncbi:uncharacterized protein LOC107980740 [Nasonia vitripennis]|uniref:Uncharacterized protein n=1 Tax=Nasonia vitripennis TaxID=7425 RepID=A0A7M7Q375_NASVI|nr:uncharacterized protein LOC107980740 [Nasonia vitripennis]XP_031780212.1 uncharacterized protein LOC107980740 [Nasonia vitripennis]